MSYGAGRVGNGCVSARCLTGNHRARNLSLFDGPHRLTGLAVEHIQERLLRRLSQDRRFDSVDHDVGKHGDLRGVVVPDVVLHELEVPGPLTRLDVERDQAR